MIRLLQVTVTSHVEVIVHELKKKIQKSKTFVRAPATAQHTCSCKNICVELNIPCNSNSFVVLLLNLKIIYCVIPLLISLRWCSLVETVIAELV